MKPKSRFAYLLWILLLVALARRLFHFSSFHLTMSRGQEFPLFPAPGRCNEDTR
jgi:hypothetical protein